MLYLLLRVAFIYFHPANRARVFLGSKLRLALICFFVMTMHEFHIRYQSDPKARSGRNNCPRPAQGLAYRHTSDQTYATKHIASCY